MISMRKHSICWRRWSRDYNGTLLLVSHDRAFIDNVVTSTLVFEGAGRIHEYVGGYSDWLRQRRPAAAAAPAPPAAKAAAARAARSRAAKPRKRSYKEQRELDAIPATIQRLEREQAALQAAVSDPELFRRSPAEASAALQRLQRIAQELEAAYARWDTLESPG